MDEKMNQLMHIMQDVRDEVHRVNKKVKDQEFSTQKYVKSSTNQIQNIEKTIAEST